MFISRVRHIWGLLAFAAAFGPLYGQQERNYSFTSFGAAQGLASSEIISLYQDHNRFIWIGHTAGISRWDGYSFKNYLWAGQKRIGKTYNIRQDHQQRIWVCAEGGLFALADDQVRQIAVGN
ncbi:MAG TPA: two-component regulator propeller domain-containing protein, partial [Chitinophagaceae bacterium]|nr:two-component regulator propeller domain-containing protein [Chitinophagaceae bacterium]